MSEEPEERSATEDANAIIWNFLGTIALLVANFLAAGFTIALFWHWFLMPLGVPPVKLSQAVGLWLLARVLVQGTMKRDESAPTAKWYRGVVSRLYYQLQVTGLTLLIGYVVMYLGR